MSQTYKKWAMLLLDLFIHIPCYLFLNTYLAGQGFTYDVAISWDDHIPYIKYFAPFYAFVYFFPIVSFAICWKSYEMIKAGFKAFLGAGLICLILFWLFPVRFDLRADLVPPYGVFDWIVSFFYWADNPPYNCFPSLHVAGAFLSARMIYLYRRRWSPWFYGIAVMITLSTLFIRQHYLVDVVAGYGVFYLMKALFLPKNLLVTESEGSGEPTYVCR